METTTKIQTGLRFPPELIARLKKEARKQKKSFNGYVEEILEKAMAEPLPKLRREDYLPGDTILQLGKTIPAFTREQLEADPKLAYILAE